MLIYELLTKFQSHIYDIYKRYFITASDKNIYINQIYELSKSININYNNIILKYSENEKENLSNEYLYLLKKYNNSFDELYKLIEEKYINENITSPIPSNIIYPLNNFLIQNITELALIIGFPSLDDFCKFYKINIVIPNIILDHFKILKIYEIDSLEITNEDKQTVKDSFGLMNYNFFFRVNLSQPIEIIIPYFDLIITASKAKRYVLQGIFFDDYLNLSSRIMSQVSFPKIFEKKKK